MDAVAQTILLLELVRNKTMKTLQVSALFMKQLLAPDINLLLISFLGSFFSHFFSSEANH